MSAIASQSSPLSEVPALCYQNHQHRTPPAWAVDLDECFVASEKLYTCAASVEISYVYDHLEKIVFPPA